MAAAEVLDEVGAEVHARGAERAERGGAAAQLADRADRLARAPRRRPARPRRAGAARARPRSARARARRAETARTPSSASSRRTCSESDGWARCSASAAALERAVLDRREDVLELLESHRRCLEVVKTIKATAGAHKGRSCYPCSLFASIIAGFAALRGARPAPRRRIAPWLRRAPRACAPPQHLTPPHARASRCASCRPAASASWRSSPRRPTPPGSASRRCSPRASCWPRPCFWAIVACARARRRARARAARRAPPRRVVLAGLALGAIGYAAQAGLLLLRAAPHRRLADVAAALHVPRARLLRRGRAAPRARHAVEGARARARQRGRRARAARRRHRRAARRPASLLGARRRARRTRSTSSSPTASSRGSTRSLLGALVATGAAATFLVAGVVERRARRSPARRLDLDRRDRAVLDGRCRSRRSCSAWSASARRRRRSCRRSSRSSRSRWPSRCSARRSAPAQIARRRARARGGGRAAGARHARARRR